MRFSVTDWSFMAPGTDPGPHYERLRALGYDAVEMTAPGNWARARAAGLEVLNLCAPGMELGLNRLEHHDDLIPRIRETIVTAGENGIPYVIVFSGNRAGLSDAEGIDNVRCALEELAEDAGENNVTLLFEMLNTFDHRDHQADRAGFGFTLVEELKAPRVKLLYDIYHMERMGEPALEDIPAHLADIAHLHVAQAPRRTVPVPGGAIDYCRIVSAVVKAGYAGYWGMEFRPTGDGLADLKKARRLFLEWAGGVNE